MVVLLSRLKGVFRKSLNCHPSIVNYVKRPVVGNLPGDLLSKLISANPSNKRDAIVGVQDVFSDASKVLGEVNTLDSQGIMRTSFSDLINNTICKTDYSLLNWWKSDSCYQEKELEILLKAEETLLKGLKKYLPEVANVKFAPIGEGAYSNVYKLEIFDVNTNKIIDDKTIKVYREKFKMITDAFSNKVNRFLDGTPDEEVYRTIKPFENNASYKNVVETSEPITMANIGEEKKKLKIAFEKLKDYDDESYNFKRQHGVTPEANSAEYVRYHSGRNLTYKDGVEVPSYFNLGDNSFAISNYIGEDKKAATVYPFMRLGLKHTDLYDNLNNSINNVCIDLGGIEPKLKSIVGNKEALSVLKRVFDLPEAKQEKALEALRNEVASKNMNSGTRKCIDKMESLLQKDPFVYNYLTILDPDDVDLF